MARSYPIHVLQTPILFGERFKPGSWTLSHLFTVSRGSIGQDEGLFRQALNELLDRHEALRYRFEPHPTQRKIEDPDYWWQTHRQIPTPSRLPRTAVKLFGSVAEFPDRPQFTTTRPPYLRLCVALGDDDVIHARLDTHHVVADMWSCRLLQNDLTALLDGRTALESRPPPYGEFVEADHQAFMSGKWDDSLAWWRDVLRDPPTHRWPGKTGESGRSAWMTSVEADRHAAVQRQLARLRCTPFTLLACAYARALTRAYGWSRLLLFVLYSNRRPAAMRTVGQFANIVYLPIESARSVSLDDQVKVVGPLVREMLGRHGHVWMWDVAAGLDPDAVARLTGAPQIAIREVLGFPPHQSQETAPSSDAGEVDVHRLLQPGGVHNMEADLMLDFAYDAAAGLHLKLSYDRSLVTDEAARQALVDIAAEVTSDA